MDKIYWKSKKGTTLVEVLAAVIILAIVAVAVLTSIGFSQTTIFSGSSEGDAAAQAQSIADALIPELNSKDPSAVKAETVGDAVYVEPGSFPNATKDKQFTISDLITDTITGTTTTIKGYRVKTAVYYSDGRGRKCVQMTAFAAKDGG